MTSPETPQSSIRHLPEVSTRRPGKFRYSKKVLTPTESDLELGRVIRPLFHNSFKRSQPMMVDLKGVDLNPLAGSLTVDNKKLLTLVRRSDPSSRSEGFDISTEHYVIPLSLLNRERISRPISRLIADAWRTELLLPDFSQSGQQYYGRIDGLHEGYIQWSSEEVEHHKLLGEILIRSCGWTRDQLNRERTLTLTREWIPSFDSHRQMIIYAEGQEAATRADYLAIAENLRLNDEPAPVAAEMIEEIGKQEAYHFSWYRAVVTAYSELNNGNLSQAVAQDVYTVYRNFYMPYDAIASRSKYLDDSGGVSRETDYDQIIGMNARSLATILFDVYRRHPFTDDRILTLIGGRNAGIIQLHPRELDRIQSLTPEQLSDEIDRDSNLRQLHDSAKVIQFSKRQIGRVA